MKIEIKCKCGASFLADNNTSDYFAANSEGTDIRYLADAFIKKHDCYCEFSEETPKEDLPQPA